jgi:hypothetical protein
MAAGMQFISIPASEECCPNYRTSYSTNKSWAVGGSHSCYHPYNQERAINLSILNMSGTYWNLYETSWSLRFTLHSVLNDAALNASVIKPCHWSIVSYGISMYLKQSSVLYPPLRTRCGGRTFVRLTEDWPPQDEVGVPCASWYCTNPNSNLLDWHSQLPINYWEGRAAIPGPDVTIKIYSR